MAVYIIRNSLNPDKVAKLSISYKKQVLKGHEGDPIWIVEVSTLELDQSGNSITPEYIYLTSLDNLDEEVERVSEIVSGQIDWTPLADDHRAPYVVSHSPTETTDVSIESDVVANIKESLPSAGIDMSSVNITVNGYDVTSESRITGDPYEYRVEWQPFLRVYDTY
ncbi:MAG: hypothetical protein ACTSV7_06715 [Candidatus Baldrarchaeia archaeon]